MQGIAIQTGYFVVTLVPYFTTLNSFFFYKRSWRAGSTSYAHAFTFSLFFSQGLSKRPDIVNFCLKLNYSLKYYNRNCIYAKKRFQ